LSRWKGESSVSYDFEVIGPYHVVDTLGQGGMGTVYKGVHAKTKDEVAIKVISANIAQHARFRRRFDAEIQTLLRLKHPNIVQLIGFGEEKGLLFYSMEYVAGENLHQMLRREKKFRWETVLDWGIEIGSALKHAHDLGIIHRDLKPANLMVNPEGHIKLTDFGIAKLFGASEETVPGSVLGTADFMSPEQAEGKPVTLRSDLYALGAICYTALSGRPPFTGTNVPEILFNVRYGNFTRLRELAPEAPVEFCDLIEELMKRDPAQRPPTTIVVNKRLQSLKMGLSKVGSNPTNSDLKKGPRGTQSGSDETSLNLSDHPSLANVGQDPAQTRMVSPQAAQKPRISTEESQKGEIAGPNDATLEAPSVSNRPSLEDQPSGIGQIQNTNFTQVTDSDRKRSALVIADKNDSEAWTFWLGVGGLALLLLACLGAGYWFSRPPSAETLYRPIGEAIASDDRSRFESVEETAQRFLELYPEDERVPEVTAELEQLQIERTVRQLQRRSQGRSDVDLDALEQAFVDCSRATELNPLDAKRKLAALLVVFPETETMSLRHRKLIAAARRMLAGLESDSLGKETNLASESLEQQMRWAETHLSPEDRKAWLRSMIELYQEKPWAEPLVKSAKQMVDTEP
jgi:serine/threonine protein kinase